MAAVWFELNPDSFAQAQCHQQYAGNDAKVLKK